MMVDEAPFYAIQLRPPDLYPVVDGLPCTRYGVPNSS